MNAYHTTSDQSLFWEEYDTGGLEIKKWADTSHRAWELFDDNLQKYGQPQMVWVNVCERAQNIATVEDVQNAITILRDKVGEEVTVYISPLNRYDTDVSCTSMLNGSSYHIEELVLQTLENDPTLRAGPIIGPMGKNELRKEGCHLNQKGLEVAGKQMVDFFDHLNY